MFSNFAVYPYGVAVDKSGNLFIADNYYYGSAGEVFLNNGKYDSGISLGTFLEPWGIAVDADDNVYIAENGAGDVIKLTATPNGYTSSVLPTTGLGSPFGIAVDAAGAVYIVDGDHERVLKETPHGNTYTQTTVPTSHAVLAGIAIDSAGTLYLTDVSNDRVLKETPSGSSYIESTVADNIPYQPVGIAVDGSGNVYILATILGGSDEYNVLKETPTAGGYVQSLVNFAPYQNPYGIAADAAGDVFLDSPSLSGLVKLSPPPADFGPLNVGGPSASFSMIFTFDSPATLGTPLAATQGVKALDFIDAGSGSCTFHGEGNVFNPGDGCSVDINFRPQFAGLRRGAADLFDTAGNLLATAYVSGTGVASQPAFPPGKQAAIDTGLGRPQGVAVDAAGNIFVADYQGGVLYKETRSGIDLLRTLVASGLNHPTGVAVDGAGNLFVATATGLYQETLLAGSYTRKPLMTNLTKLTGVAVDGDGNLYLTSSASGDVHKETLGIGGAYIETAIGFGITHPGGLTVDENGTVFVTDPEQGVVYRETPQVDGTYRQTTVATGLAGPQNVAVDAGGDLYITASLNGEVYRETPDGDAYVQSIAASSLVQPWGIGVDGRGNLYLSLAAPSGELRMVDVSDPPILNFSRTPVGSTSRDSPQLVTLANIGNAALSILVPGSGSNPTITPGFTLGTSSTCPVLGFASTGGSVAPTSSCGYEISYQPVAPGAIRGAMVITDASLAEYSTLAAQRIELRQGITSDITRVSLRVTPGQIKKGLAVDLTATVTDTSVASILPQGGSVTFTDIILGKATVLHGGTPVPLSGGKAELQFFPVPGQHTLTAHYSGVNAKFDSSTATAMLSVYNK